MTNAALHRWLLVPLLAIIATLIDRESARAQAPEGADLSIELVDPKVLRVCADPRNLPFSNEKGEGFENKLAELFAEKLQKKLDYMFFPQATGFVRMTLGAHRCDVIMGFPQGDELVQGTNPYYRTAYALVAKRGSGLEDVASLGDERLKGKHLGIVAGTPPATNMAVNGLMTNARPYQLMIDTRIDSSAVAMIKDLMAGEIDAARLARHCQRLLSVGCRGISLFDDPNMRRAMALSLDRKAFIDIISEGQGDIGGVMQPCLGNAAGCPENAAGLSLPRRDIRCGDQAAARLVLLHQAVADGRAETAQRVRGPGR